MDERALKFGDVFNDNKYMKIFVEGLETKYTVVCETGSRTY